MQAVVRRHVPQQPRKCVAAPLLAGVVALRDVPLDAQRVIDAERLQKPKFPATSGPENVIRG